MHHKAGWHTCLFRRIWRISRGQRRRKDGVDIINSMSSRVANPMNDDIEGSLIGVSIERHGGVIVLDRDRPWNLRCPLSR